MPRRSWPMTWSSSARRSRSASMCTRRAPRCATCETRSAKPPDSRNCRNQPMISTSSAPAADGDESGRPPTFLVLKGNVMKTDPSSEVATIPTGAGASAEASSNGMVHTTLENGLGVLIIPDHRAPVVTHMVWYKNGSADDPVGKSGIAHFLEHLMFKGTQKHPAGTFMTTIAELGGQQNAFTSNDFTAYFQQIAAEHLATCMEYESDRMKNLVLTEEAVNAERKVVLEERLMRTDSKPGQIIGEALQAALFTTHPYGKPI